MFLTVKKRKQEIEMLKIGRILILLVLPVVQCDKYVYADYFNYSKLPSFGLNPDDPYEAIEILIRNQVGKVNIFGALNGLINIAKSQNQSLANVYGSLHSKEAKEIFAQVEQLHSVSNHSGCEESKDYAHTEFQGKCKLLIEEFLLHKLEVLNEEPSVILIHEYLSSYELERWSRAFFNSEDAYHMKSLYQTSESSDKEEFEALQSFKREGKIGFVLDSEFTEKSDRKLKKILKFVTKRNLDTNSCDSYQFGTYGIGGFIDEHLDTYGKPSDPMESILDFQSEEVRKEWKGDRLFTALHYINGHPKQGGSTIFPNLQITVPPIEGDLLIWQNLNFATLVPLTEALHKSCPVLYGPKLVLNKWIRAY